jgi:sugar/nucleoside kinase (ribokinase family)
MTPNAKVLTLKNELLDAGPEIILGGDNCLNIVLHIKGVLQRGANLDVTRVVRRPGGNALVTAMALTGWGVRSRYYGVIGEDSEGAELRKWMQAAGLDTDGVIIRKIATRISYVILDEHERTIIDLRNPTAPEAELQDSDWSQIHGIDREMQRAKAILLDKYCSHIHERVKQIIKLRRDKGESPVLIYRTGSRQSAELQIESGILPAANIILTKSTFLAGVNCGPDIVEGCRSLSHRFNVPVVVATAGKDGASYFDGRYNRGAMVPAITVSRPLTTLGGGDFFRAGFILAYLEGKSVEESVQMGNIAAAIHISRAESDRVEEMFYGRAELKV